jgi:hypothetical protein
MKRIRMEKNTAKATNLSSHPHSGFGSSFPAHEAEHRTESRGKRIKSEDVVI